MSYDYVLSVNNVSKCFNIYKKPSHRLFQMLLKSRKKLHEEFWALKNINFDITRGQSVGIMGRNGAGKSTLLQIICGTLNPSFGDVKINGKVAALLELGAGFNPEFSGRDNVYLCASLYGMSQSQVEARYQSIADFADIGDFINQPVKTYSSGMYVRLAFAVIAHVDADILIIDEALAVGDALFTQKCMRFLREFKKTGVLLFVSHDITTVKNLCEKALWLESGEVREFGTAKSVSEKYLARLYKSEIKHSTEASDRCFDDEDFVDGRMVLLNQSTLRNDIEIFKFDKKAKSSFGSGMATIESAYLMSDDGNPLSWCVGGEMVKLEINSRVYGDLTNPIIGFTVNDRLGQPLFGDNTFLSYLNDEIVCTPGQLVRTSFTFRMPLLMSGDYSLSVAIASGTQDDHIQHHWLNDAILFRSHSTSASTGLIGIPMKKIELTIVKE